MTVINAEESQTGPWTYYYTWGSTLGSPTYFIYRNGVLDIITEVETLQVDLMDGENIVLEIFDSISDLPSPAFPNYANFQWNPSSDDQAKTYLIQQFISSVWETIATIADTGQSVYRYQTTALEDDVTHQFRIVPVDFNAANEGAIRNITFRMRRYPPGVDVTYTYDSGTGNITIAAA